VSAAFSPDGKASSPRLSDKTARLWDAESSKQIGEPLSGHSAVTSAAFSPDGKLIVTASSDKTARLWGRREAASRSVEPLSGHRAAVTSAAFRPDGKRIVTASWDRTAWLWDAESGQPIGEPLSRPYGCCKERGVQPRRQAHRHRVFGQNGAAVGRRE